MEWKEVEWKEVEKEEEVKEEMEKEEEMEWKEVEWKEVEKEEEVEEGGYNKRRYNEEGESVQVKQETQRTPEKNGRGGKMARKGETIRCMVCGKEEKARRGRSVEGGKKRI
ncbi:hypothetical protein Pmani_021508 [Petrolisthes manimaculis]|uniref:Uncharacterized protein n=1 Tax=Petrolisthes manimaculis TaxID=1843537 RepID=A0AAE1U1M5_9EUCA|nr:hypothetical protein Pmani_021508 [Petrolisthes manimaculis]